MKPFCRSCEVLKRLIKPDDKGCATLARELHSRPGHRHRRLPMTLNPLLGDNSAQTALLFHTTTANAIILSGLALGNYSPTKGPYTWIYTHADTDAAQFGSLCSGQQCVYYGYIRRAYKNTRLVTTAAHNRVSVSDCPRAIVRPRQFLIITRARFESAMMPLTLSP